jgi:Ca2+/Na+ antiporter
MERRINLMDGGIAALLFFVLSVVFFIIQRAERKRRRLVFLIMLVVFELIRRYTWFRDVHTEAWVALIGALLLNVAFWLFIGRYNPVASSDEIRVLRMND